MNISAYRFFNMMVVVRVFKKKAAIHENDYIQKSKFVYPTYLPKMTSMRAKNPMKTNAGL